MFASAASTPGSRFASAIFVATTSCTIGINRVDRWTVSLVSAAAVVGAISQVRMAQDGNISFEDAVVAWALWSALWLVTAYIGSRYLSDEGAVLEGRTGGAP